MNKKTKKLASQEAIESKETQGVDDMLAMMNDMTDAEMESTLVELSTTRAWVAMLKYTRFRSALVDGALRSVDPFKEPTQMARNQGIAIGMKDLFEYVDAINTKNKEAAEDAQRKAEEERKAAEVVKK